jgi:hypothetical protein
MVWEVERYFCEFQPRISIILRNKNIPLLQIPKWLMMEIQTEGETSIPPLPIKLFNTVAFCYEKFLKIVKQAKLTWRGGQLYWVFPVLSAFPRFSIEYFYKSSSSSRAARRRSNLTLGAEPLELPNLCKKSTCSRVYKILILLYLIFFT